MRRSVVDKLRGVRGRCPGGIRGEVRWIQRSLVGAADGKPAPKSGKGEIEAVGSAQEVKNLVQAVASRLVEEVVIARATGHGVRAAAARERIVAALTVDKIGARRTVQRI